jgi:hypothetical protein
VRAPPATDALDDPSRVGTPEPEHMAVEHDDEVVSQRTLAVPQRPRDHLRHAGIALQRGERSRLGCPGAQLGLQPGDGRELHVSLAQRREYLSM